MPNAKNILCPINIHGLGRSGTTLLQNIFGATGFIQVCNEMQPAVFCGYAAGTLSSASHDKEINVSANKTQGVLSVHAILTSLMPSSKPSWCQKVGGLPNYLNLKSLATAEDRLYYSATTFPFKWYWEVIHACFPLAANVLILRDFRDVVVSRCRFSKFSVDDIVADIAVYSNLLLHGDARIDVAIGYRSLARQPETAVSHLFRQIGYEYAESYLRALQWHAVPTPGRSLGESAADGFSWEPAYDEVLGLARAKTLAELYRVVCERFSVED